jgi:thiamine biosynthesis lipoprotein
LERAAGWLREAGIASALLNGGTSSIYALGRPPDAESWRVAVEGPPQARQDAQAPYSITVPLRDEAMSVSAVWGRSFEAEGKVFGHVLDPRNGLPVAGAVLSVVVLPSATETDALSTALLVAGETGHERIAGLREGMRSLVISDSRQGHGQGQGLQIHGRGITAEKANG